MMDMSTSEAAVDLETHLPSRISSITSPEAPQLELLLPTQQQLKAAMQVQGSIRKQASAACMILQCCRPGKFLT
jgi:hypothetical protein